MPGDMTKPQFVQTIPEPLQTMDNQAQIHRRPVVRISFNSTSADLKHELGGLQRDVFQKFEQFCVSR